jgi:hypothetical protein
MTLPILVILSPRNRALALQQTLESVSAQGILPAELIVVG